MVTSLRTAVLQSPAGMDVAASLARLRAGIAGLEAGTLAVAPEGQSSSRPQRAADRVDLARSGKTGRTAR